ncbi:MAG: condensation domain-containing protein [Vicinamibacterales bacterium]
MTTRPDDASAAVGREPPSSPGEAQPDLYECPAAPNQQGLWFIDRLSPGSPAYNIPLGFELTGRVDWAAFQQALDALVDRHESLRTTLSQVEGRVMQIIAAQGDVRVAHVPVEPGPDALARARILATELAARPVDLERGPLFTVTRVGIDDEHAVLLVNAHHSIADGWSMLVLLRDLGRLYDAIRRGQSADLPALPVQYADFVLWQEQRLTPARVESQLAYWRRALEGASEALDLPLDRPRPPMPSGLGGRVAWTIDAATTEALRALARAEGVTMFMLLVTLLEVLLARLSGQDDISIGVPFAGRTRPEVEQVVGYFANPVVIRLQLEPEDSIRACLARVRTATLEAFEHGDVPFQGVVEGVRPERHLSRNPLFQVLCTVQRVPESMLAMDGVGIEQFDIGVGRSRFDLLVDFRERSADIIASIEYDADLFDDSTVQRWTRHFGAMARAVVANPDLRLSAAPILDAADATLVEAWGHGPVAAAEPPVPAQVAAQAAARPGAPAIVFGDETVEYAGLWGRVERLTARLRRAGVPPGARVGIALPRSVDMVVAVLATMRAGAAYVPLDPAFPPARLSHMVRDSGMVAIITQEDLIGGYETLPDLVIRMDDPAGATDGGHEAEHADAATAANDEAMPAPTDLAYVLYTSGSTGLPKGVEIPHGALSNLLGAMRRQPGFTARDRLLAVTTLSFDIAGLELLLPLTTGGVVILADREEAMDPVRLARRLETSAATVMQATPATWRALVEAGWDGRPGLTALCGGEALPPRLAAALVPRVRALWNMYGPTETTIWSTCARITNPARVTVGRPSPTPRSSSSTATGRSCRPALPATCSSPVTVWRAATTATRR